MKIFIAVRNIILIIGIFLLAWIFVSFCDTNVHNDPFDEDYQNYASWNFFEVFFGE